MLVTILVALAAIVLLSLVSVGTVLPPKPEQAQAEGVLIGVWCPASGRIERVRIGRGEDPRGLAILDCERFNGGPLLCDRICLHVLADLRLSPDAFDVRQALVFPSTN